MSKSEFVGTCQICGRIQKLPKKRLSLHGYTVEWQMFTGTCPGSGHAPFEISCGLIEDAILQAKRQAQQLAAMRDDYLKPATEPVGFVSVYLDYKEIEAKYGRFVRGKSGYRWIKGRIERREPKHGQYFVVIDETDGREHYIYGRFNDTPLSVADHFRKNYSLHLQNEISNIERYIAWQEDRIANWEPKELTPVQEGSR